MFGLWYTLILGKLITIAYRVKLINVDYDFGEDISLWTDDPNKIVNLKSIEGYELLMFAGFLLWHFGFSIVFGALAVVTERVIASMLIDNYEVSSNVYIPIILTLLYQLLAIGTSIAMVFYKLGMVVLNGSWIICFVFCCFMYFYIKRINVGFIREMENPRRKRVFTVSQRFQVKENLRAIALGRRLVYSVLFSIVCCGIGMLALIYDIVPSCLLHIGENFMYCHPLFVCFVWMYGHPTWKSRFKKAFPKIRPFKLKRHKGVVSVEIVEDNMKKLSMETDIYFNQLKDSWI